MSCNDFEAPLYVELGKQTKLLSVIFDVFVCIDMLYVSLLHRPEQMLVHQVIERSGNRYVGQ